MTFRDLAFMILGLVLAAVGITANILWGVEVGMAAFFLLGLLILMLVVLQRRSQARLQERILFLMSAEKTRQNMSLKEVRQKPSLESDAVLMKKIIGLLQAQQISMEHLKAEFSREAERPRE